MCGRKTGKSDLLRIVAAPDGPVTVDPTGKLAGRGAYVCADGRCSGEPLRKSRLDHALRRRSEEEDWARIDSSLGELRQAG